MKLNDPLVFIPNETNISRAKSKGKLKQYIRNASSNFIKRKEVREFVFNRDGFKCAFCGNPNELQVDHVISVYRLGMEANHIDNLQTLCRWCNSSKKV